MDGRLIYSCDVDRSGYGRRKLALRCAAGDLTRLRNGVYVATGTWKSMPWWEQYLLQIEAAVGKGRTERILVQYSAAAAWGMPVLGRSPDVHLLASRGTHGGRRAGIRWHETKILEPLGSFGGFTLTSRAQTAVDLAAHAPFEHAVAAVDHVLRADTSRNLPPLDKATLFALVPGLPAQVQRLRANRVIRFGDARAQLPGESLSRAQMYLFNFPAPELQHPVVGPSGELLGITDFFWKDFRLVGEFDGSGKYSRGEYLAGGSPADAVEREKIREDRIRATGLKFVRWMWDAAWTPASPRNPRGLVRILTDAGLTQDRWNRRWPQMPD